MLAQIYLINKEYHLFLCDSTQRKLTLVELRTFLETFTSYHHYSNFEDGHSEYGVLTPSTGDLLAQITDNRELIVYSPHLFVPIFHMKEPQYLTVEEYAEKVGRKPNMIGKLCRSGRLPGAYQQGARWLIPEDTPYPSTSR